MPYLLRKTGAHHALPVTGIKTKTNEIRCFGSRPYVFGPDEPVMEVFIKPPC
jgi:hypothetical protein